MDKILELSVKVPANVAEDVDADEIRVAIEEFVEKFLKMIVMIDDSVMCEPSSTTVYRATYTRAERVDACYGRLPDGRHVHAIEKYGTNMNECWYSFQLYIEPFNSLSRDHEVK